MKSLRNILTPPLLSVALLGGIVVEYHTHVKPDVVEPFHKNAKAIIEAMPTEINGNGYWIGKKEKPQEAAVKILHPNAYFAAHYVDTGVSSSGAMPNRFADLLVVQCKDANDMQGHYPPICYPASGDTLRTATDKNFVLGDLSIPCREYEFVHTKLGGTDVKHVYDFIVVPRRGIFRGMEGISKAASDYQQRYFGAAQFQVLINQELPESERDEIFKTLIGANTAVVQTLVKGAIQ